MVQRTGIGRQTGHGATRGLDARRRGQERPPGSHTSTRAWGGWGERAGGWRSPRLWLRSRSLRSRRRSPWPRPGPVRRPAAERWSVTSEGNPDFLDSGFAYAPESWQILANTGDGLMAFRRGGRAGRRPGGARPGRRAAGGLGRRPRLHVRHAPRDPVQPPGEPRGAAERHEGHAGAALPDRPAQGRRPLLQHRRGRPPEPHGQGRPEGRGGRRRRRDPAHPPDPAGSVVPRGPGPALRLCGPAGDPAGGPEREAARGHRPVPGEVVPAQPGDRAGAQPELPAVEPGHPQRQRRPDRHQAERLGEPGPVRGRRRPRRLHPVAHPALARASRWPTGTSWSCTARSRRPPTTTS